MARCVLILLFLLGVRADATELHANGKTISLTTQPGWDVQVALDRLHRVRFLAAAPDGRIFATDMYNRADNTRGQVLILNGWDAKTGRFAGATPYLEHLRNPNNVAFYTDGGGQSWLYLTLTDRLVRYRYRPGDVRPGGEPDVLARYPDYGLDYKYGGWHLTRTVAVGKVAGKDRLFVAVGSSCNACVEKEAVRATISMMDVDGRNAIVIAKNVRNAVGLAWDAERSVLLATNMGDDQLGDAAPEDTLLAFTAAEIEAAERNNQPLDGGWPACYFKGGVARPDPEFGKGADCSTVKRPMAVFAAHSSPLGVVRAGLSGGYLVALHGAGHSRIGTGYRVVVVSGMHAGQQEFLSGFLSKGAVTGRPCGMLRVDADSYLVTDDLLGAIYFVHRTK